jgi:selenocysteine lyase/cysteine desulfurase
VHKWLFGPYGLSFLYAAEAWWQDERTEPLVQDEHNRLGADGDIVLPFDAIRGYAEDFARGARRFDAGGRPNPILLPMVSAALKQVMAWRPDRIEVSLKPLMARLVSGARALDLVTPRHHGPHLVGIGPGPQDVPQGGCHIEELAEYAELLAAREKWADEASSYLHSRRIFVSSRGGSLRVAVHVYNSIEDVGIFLEAMRAFVQPRRAASTSLL